MGCRLCCWGQEQWCQWHILWGEMQLELLYMETLLDIKVNGARSHTARSARLVE